MARRRLFVLLGGIVPLAASGLALSATAGTNSVTAASGTALPELVSTSLFGAAPPASGASSSSGEIVRFVFDEALAQQSLVAADFHLVGFDADLRFDGQSVLLEDGGKSARVTFGTASAPVTAAQLADISLASVSTGAVSDAGGKVNPPGSVPLGTTRTVPNKPGVTVGPALVDVSSFSSALTDPTPDPTDTHVTFRFDRPAYVTSGSGGGWHLAMQDGSTIACTYSSGSGTTTVTTTCPNPGTLPITAISPSQVTRAYADAGVVSTDPQNTSLAVPQGGVNVLRTVAVTAPPAGAPPHLSTVTYKPRVTVSSGSGRSRIADEVVYGFDQPVTLGTAAPCGTTVGTTAVSTGACFVVSTGDSRQITGANTANSGPVVPSNPPRVVNDSTGQPRQVVVTVPAGTVNSAVGVAVQPGAVSAASGSKSAGQADSLDQAFPDGGVTFVPGNLGLGTHLVAIHVDDQSSPLQTTYYFDRDLRAGGTKPVATDLYLLDADGTRLRCAAATEASGGPTGSNNSVTCTSYQVIGTVTGGALAPTAPAGDDEILDAVTGAIEAGAVTAGDGAQNPEDAAYVDQQPAVNAVQPSRGPATGGTHVTITGTGFGIVRSVHFGSTSATSYTVVSPTQINAVAPRHDPGVVEVTVTTVTGTSAATAGDGYTYVTPPPTVTGVSPRSGTIRGGTRITITGTNFYQVKAIHVGRTPITHFTVVSPARINAVTPAHGSGANHLTVTTSYGTSRATSHDVYTYER